MIPMSNTSSYERFRQGQAQRRSLVRSSSSLLGSIKNFVAAPFARLFTGTSNDFDDPNDLSVKRRLVINQNVDNNDIVEDGPAPAKRMRVRSPEPPSPPRSTAYLDPPGSAFHLDHKSNLSSNPPSRSASISLPSTTLPASTAHNVRSTVSPLRNTFSRNMSIDSIPSNLSRPLSRDISMKSFSSKPVERSFSIRAGSRDSMPPLATQSFRLRDSSTPQPHHSMGRQPNRDLSEPPPVTVLHSNPVFVRGPTQVIEPQSQPVPTLGSLVDSQRIVRSPSRQRTLLFGSSKHAVDPQAIVAERTLHELEFYKTPLVPTRIRSRMPSSLGASASSSNITDMFARKHSLILMGDHARPTKRDKKSKGKGKGKETNETKPYAGTTGIRKRLAKAKAKTPSQKEQSNSTSDHVTDVTERNLNAVPSSSKEVTEVTVPELPVPPLKEKDTFNVAAFPPSTSPAQQSSLRVGRAARSHLSRPIKKFSASYDDEDDKVGDEAKKDFEMLTEAARKVPTFEIPAGFSFAKEAPPIESAATAKEPPISALPFSLTISVASPASPPPAQTSFNGPAETGVSSGSLTSPFLGAPQINRDVSSSSGTDDTAGKVPNFFTASKALASPFPVSPLIPVTMSSGSISPFSFAPRPVSVPEEPALLSTFIENTKQAETGSSLFGASVTPSSYSGSQSSPVPPTSTEPATDSPRKDDPRPSPFSFGPAVNQPPPTSQSLPFSSKKPSENARSVTSSVTSAPISFGTPAAATEVTPKAGSFSFGAPPSGSDPISANVFGASNGINGDAKSSGAFSFATSTENAKPSGSSLFGSSTETDKLASSSLFGVSGESTKLSGSSPFTFGQPSPQSGSESSIVIVPSKSTFGSQVSTTESSKLTFGGADNNSLGNPFSFVAPTSATPEPPKSLFGAASANVTDSSKSAGITFGSSSAPSTSAGIGTSSSHFTFGSGGSTTNGTSSSPFIFGVTPARPVTPPNQDHEVRMEESPTRDIQANKPADPRPALSVFPFSSAPSSTTSSLFGQSSAAPVSSGFSFGQSSTAPNSFGTDKQTENKPFGISTNPGGHSAASPFSFGRTAENEPPRPSTTGSFSFGNATNPSTGPGTTFSFGAPSNNSAVSNPFGVAQTANPNSPSTFGPPSSFSFGATPGSGTGNPFAFGSQPASPATPNAGLPSSGFTVTSSNPFGAPAASSSGFGSPSAAVAPSGGSLFTIGSAPPDSNRQIKRLPNRKKR